jgi:amino acid transporter
MRTIPISCIVTCLIVCVIYFGTCLAVLAYLPWDPAKDGFVGLVENEGNAAAYIMSIFCEKMLGKGFAIFFTFVVIYCIYGSCFSLLLGFAQIPWAAAHAGMFYEIFGHTHKDGFADYGILYMGFATCAFCFVELEVVIEGMMTTSIATMFLANSAALVYHRWNYPDAERPYEMPYYPWPVVIQVIMFTFVFLTSDNWIIMGNAPLLEMGLAFLGLGTIAFLYQSHKQKKWPFEGSLDEQNLVVVAGHVLSTQTITPSTTSVEMYTGLPSVKASPHKARVIRPSRPPRGSDL